MSTVRIEFEFTAKDYKEAVQAFQRHLRSARAARQGVLFEIIGVIIVLAALFLSGLTGPTRAGCIGGGLTMVILGLFPGYFPLAWRRAFANQQQMHGRFEVTFDDPVISAAGPMSKGEMRWALFDKYVETNNLFVLRRSSVMFFAYPKRAFTPPDLDTFRSLLQRNVLAKT